MHRDLHKDDPIVNVHSPFGYSPFGCSPSGRSPFGHSAHGYPTGEHSPCGLPPFLVVTMSYTIRGEATKPPPSLHYHRCGRRIRYRTTEPRESSTLPFLPESNIKNVGNRRGENRNERKKRP
ncbi:hypothetical protein BDM02DRAFT_1766019 [Thelephora ganbajun]|uniref:Uncharacterized protein n=1 Tax=Thelephora ganbajun TaxID=370292 RepID=A0ACB6ZJZ3_THEGA|nr:hypothetical protein BDM02DRAFT_1766019 [Thelephora ganbajun]